MYALLTPEDGNQVRQMISWNMPFQSYSQCEYFLRNNTKRLLGGVIQLTEELHSEIATVKEMGCSTATVYYDTPNDPPTITDKRSHYSVGTSI